MSDAFTVRIAVRGYEIDANGHVAGSVLMQYGQHARWECLRAAGVEQSDLLRQRLGPVSLEERIRFHHELTASDELDVSCVFVWDHDKTFRTEQELRLADGTLAAEVTNVGGLLDLDERRLVTDPGARWRAIAAAPQVIGF
jgi:acyl-CoA thioester hydrolase